jgi:hypothetical protein
MKERAASPCSSSGLLSLSTRIRLVALCNCNASPSRALIGHCLKMSYLYLIHFKAMLIAEMPLPSFGRVFPYLGEDILRYLLPAKIADDHRYITVSASFVRGICLSSTIKLLVRDPYILSMRSSMQPNSYHILYPSL